MEGGDASQNVEVLVTTEKEFLCKGITVAGYKVSSISGDDPHCPGRYRWEERVRRRLVGDSGL